MAGTTEETGQGQDMICLRAGVVSMEEDSLWPLQSTAMFQRLMAHALTIVTKKYGNLIMCYVDDVGIARPTLEDHIERQDEVFACMKRAGLKCKPSKCEILKGSIKYLGRMVDKHGIRPDPDAVDLMSFLGFVNY